MCKLVPVLRIVGFVFLVLAFVACLIGFLAPFWVRLPVDRPAAVADDDAATNTETTTLLATQPGGQRSGEMVAPVAASSTLNPPAEMPSVAPAIEAGVGARMEESLRTFLPNGSYEGLWAKCYHNLTCSCFWQNDFEMEKAFPIWHQAAQGLFGIGLIVLLVALVTASFHICCCHCCSESFAIATVIGSLIVAGLLLVTFSLAVFGIFSTVKNDVQLTGSVSVFEWAFYVPIGGVGVALLAAILFIIDGRRGPSDSDGDGEETAKMV